jgi:putative transposase
MSCKTNRHGLDSLAVVAPRTSQAFKPGRERRYLSGGHTRHRLVFHLVWIPKYRRGVLRGLVAHRAEGLIREIAVRRGWVIQELSVQPDHVHLLVQLKPGISVSQAVQLFKGGTSMVLRMEFPDVKRAVYWDGFWADGYFAESVGVTQEETIRRYIREQDDDE